MINPSPERTPTAIETIEDQPHDQQQLRQRLLRLIIKSEAKRRSTEIGPRSNRSKFATNRTVKKRA